MTAQQPANQALPALGPVIIPQLSNIHTKARMPGADYPDLTLRTSGVFGPDIQQGLSDIVTPETIETNKALYSGQTFKVFVAKLLLFILLAVYHEDVVKYILPTTYFSRLELLMSKESLKATIVKIQKACFGDENTSLYNYIYRVLMDIQRRIRAYNAANQHLPGFVPHPILDNLTLAELKPVLRPYYDSKVLITMFAHLENTINLATTWAALTVPNGHTTWAGKYFLHERGTFASP